MDMSMQMQQETPTLGSLTLRERAAEAYEKAQREHAETREREFRKQCDSLAKLIEKVLGVEREGIVFEKRNEHGSARAQIDGLSFALYADEGGAVLQLLSTCQSCGAERSARLSTLNRLGELLSDPSKFYHRCPNQPEIAATPEARMLQALRDIIVDNTYHG